MSKNELKEYQLSGRVWCFILYPDSCCDYVNMIKKLEHLLIPMAISPLHIPSKNNREEDKQNEKKPHFHCLMYFEGQKKEKDLRKLIDYETSQFERKYFDWQVLCDFQHPYSNIAKYPFFLKINNIRSYTRYLLHLDNPEKQQFDDYKVTHFVSDDLQKYNHLVLINGFNIRDYLTCLNVSPDRQILDIVNEEEFKSINELMKYLIYNNNDFLLSYIKKNLIYVSRFLLPDLCFYNKVEQNKK